LHAGAKFVGGMGTRAVEVACKSLRTTWRVLNLALKIVVGKLYSDQHLARLDS